MGPKIWSFIASNIKKSDTLEIFKETITYWKPDNGHCRFCKIYVKGLYDIYKAITFPSGTNY